MRLRTSIVLFLAALLFTGMNAVLLVRRDAARQDAVRARRLMAVRPGEVRGCDIFRGPDHVATLERDGEDRWTVRLPARDIRDAADPQVIEELRAFLMLAPHGPVEATPTEAGVEDPASVSQAVFHTESGTYGFRAGRRTPDGRRRYVVLDEAPGVVHAVPADLLAFVERPAATYRSLNLFDAPHGELTRIVLHPGGETGGPARIVFARTEGAWVLTRPVRWPADPAELDRLLQRIRTLRARSVVADQAGDAAPFGLDADAPYIRLESEKGMQTVRFGRLKRESGLVYAQRERRPAVYLVDSGLYEEVTRNRDDREHRADRYRQRALHLLPEEPPAVIELVSSGETLRLVRSDKGWRTEGGDLDFPVEDEAVRAGLVARLRDLRVLRFVSESPGDLEAWGLARPARRIVCYDAAGRRTVALALSQGEPGKPVHGKLEGRPQIFAFDAGAAGGLLVDLIFYRSRILNDIDFRTIRRVEVTERGKGRRVYRSAGQYHWQLVEPETRLLEEGAAFLPLVQTLAYLRCRGYVARAPDDLDRFGLATPELRVRMWGTKEDAAEGESLLLDLALGHPVGKGDEADRFARVAGLDAVFLLSGEVAALLRRDFR